MRAWVSVAVVVLLGTSVGVGSTWLSFQGTSETFVPYSRTKAGEAPEAPSGAEVAATGSGPMAVIEGGSKFDFGELAHDQTREKGFVIRNAGDAPLVIQWDRASCGMCIQNGRKFDQTSIPPGGSYEVFVTYATKKPALKFSESAYLTTNDSRNSSLRLDIVGIVTKALRLSPESIALSSVSSSESTFAKVKLFGYQSEKLQWDSYSCKQAETASLFVVTATPLEPAELAKEERAKAGMELQIEIKSGLPLGPFTQTLVLNATTDAAHQIELKVEGTVVGDLTLIGKNVDAAKSSFNLGIAPSATGRTGEFFVLVKGPYRDQVKFKVLSVEPADYLQVEIGEPTSFGEGKARRIPIKVSIAAGKPPVLRFGTAQGAAGRVVLETNHPVSKELPIEVRFGVE